MTTNSESSTPEATAATESASQPPVAEKRPVSVTHHGHTRTDEYEWLRNSEDPKVIEHLEAENAYADAVTAAQKPLRDAIYEEIAARVVQTDVAVPKRSRGWWYYARTVEGSAYPIHARVKAADTGNLAADWTPPALKPGEPVEGEEILVDGNALAEGHTFFALGGLDVSLDGTKLVYAADFTGDERFTVFVKDLTTGQLLADRIEGAFYEPVFTPDGQRIVYTVVDETWRPHQIKVHTIGTDTAEDTVLYQEDDAQMWLGAAPSDDEQDLVIVAGNSEYAETWIWEGMEAGTEPRLLVSREERILNSVAPVTVDGRRQALILHDAEAPNGRLDIADLATVTDRSTWRPVIAEHPETKLNSLETTSTHAVLSVRAETTPRIRIFPLTALSDEALASGTELELWEPLIEDAGDAPVAVEASSNSFEAPVIRLQKASDTTPNQTYDADPATRECRLLHTGPVNNYSPEDYVATREWATARDGEQIPLTVLRRRDVKADGTAPTIVYGYGSYEISNDPRFGYMVPSLLDRGVVFVTAHIRGGGERGRHWYLDGKKLKKENSFNDFVDATRWLIEAGWADPKRIAAFGGSAGGLLMGAVLNQAPELYQAVLAAVPFVDPLTSILDPDLPLSALEWEEWGNPIEDEEVYRYMLGYSPYENITKQDYPLIAARTSLHDTRVLYVEPAKWVQRLREHTTSDKPVLFTCEMHGGHGGASGRYELWKDRSWEYAFMLSAIGITQ